jgi:ribosome-binding ATPase YchF (GTP1/OBG family)
LKKASRRSPREKAVLRSAKPRSKKDGRRARSTRQGDDVRRLRGFQFLSAKPLLIVPTSMRATSPTTSRRRLTRRASPFLSRATGAVAVCAKIELEIAQLEPADAPRFSRILV